jgi:hypothetical protein
MRGRSRRPERDGRTRAVILRGLPREPLLASVASRGARFNPRDLTRARAPVQNLVRSVAEAEQSLSGEAGPLDLALVPEGAGQKGAPSRRSRSRRGPQQEGPRMARIEVTDPSVGEEQAVDESGRALVLEELDAVKELACTRAIGSCASPNRERAQHPRYIAARTPCPTMSLTAKSRVPSGPGSGGRNLRRAPRRIGVLQSTNAQAQNEVA